MMQVQTLSLVSFNGNGCQSARVFQVEKLKPVSVQFNGCQVDEKIENTVVSCLVAGLFTTIGSLCSFLAMGDSSSETYDGRLDNLPLVVRHAANRLDTHLTSETVEKSYKLPEMKDVALKEKREAVLESISPVLLSIPELSDDSEETRVMVDKIKQILHQKKLTFLGGDDLNQCAIWQDAQTEACNQLITLGLDKLNDNPEAEKVIWKKLAHQLLDKNTSPEFEARYLELIDGFYEKMTQGRNNDLYWQGKAGQLFSVGWKTTTALFGTAGLLGFVLSRRRKRNEMPTC